MGGRGGGRREGEGGWGGGGVKKRALKNALQCLILRPSAPDIGHSAADKNEHSVSV